MNAVLNPIIIDQFYCPDHNCNENKTNSELLISNVTYTNITGTYSTVKPAVCLRCSNKMPCVNITIVEMQLSSAEGKEPTPICGNASGCLGKNIQPPVTCLGKGSSQFVYNLSKKGIKCTNSQGNLVIWIVQMRIQLTAQYRQLGQELATGMRAFRCVFEIVGGDNNIELE